MSIFLVMSHAHPLDLLQGKEFSNGPVTPLLDSGILPPRRNRSASKALIIGLLIGVSLMEILALAGGLWEEHWPGIFLVLFIFAVLVHELGHLIAGWAVEFCFGSIQIGPLSLERDYDTLKIRLSFDLDFIGSVTMFPTRVRILRRRSMIYIAGGPAASLLSVVVIAAASHLFHTSPTSTFATVEDCSAQSRWYSE